MFSLQYRPLLCLCFFSLDRRCIALLVTARCVPSCICLSSHMRRIFSIEFGGSMGRVCGRGRGLGLNLQPILACCPSCSMYGQLAPLLGRDSRKCYTCRFHPCNRYTNDQSEAPISMDWVQPYPFIHNSFLDGGFVAILLARSQGVP